MNIEWEVDLNWKGGAYLLGPDACVWLNDVTQKWEWAVWTPIVRYAHGSSMATRLAEGKDIDTAEDAMRECEAARDAIGTSHRVNW